jgi:hypothetical protein
MTKYSLSCFCPTKKAPPFFSDEKTETEAKRSLDFELEQELLGSWEGLGGWLFGSNF